MDRLPGGGVSGGGVTVVAFQVETPISPQCSKQANDERKGMSLPQASRHIKENNLYKK
jgi:hypothetical protein